MRRIQRRRTKGWRKPPGAIYVGRPSRWGNPWSGSLHRISAEARVRHYEIWLESRLDRSPELRRELAALRGRDLMCWCPLDQPCHADVLLRLANT